MAKKLMIVDDSKFARKLLETPLTRMGYEVETHAGPEEALAYLENPDSKPDVIITDLKMPSLDDGLEFLNELSVDHQETPIIVYTSDPHASKVVDLIGFKSVVYLAKPVSPATLVKNFEQFF